MRRLYSVAPPLLVLSAFGAQALDTALGSLPRRPPVQVGYDPTPPMSDPTLPTFRAIYADRGSYAQAQAARHKGQNGCPRNTRRTAKNALTHKRRIQADSRKKNR